MFFKVTFYWLHCKRLAPYEKYLLKPQNTVQALYTHRTNTVQALHKHRTVRCFLGPMYYFRKLCLTHQLLEFSVFLYSFSKIARHNLGTGMFSRTFPVHASCTVLYGSPCYYTSIICIFLSTTKFTSFIIKDNA